MTGDGAVGVCTGTSVGGGGDGDGGGLVTWRLAPLPAK